MNNQPNFQPPYAGPQPGPQQQWQAGPPVPPPPPKKHTGLKVAGAVVGGLALIGIGGALFSDNNPAPVAVAPSAPAESPVVVAPAEPAEKPVEPKPAPSTQAPEPEPAPAQTYGSAWDIANELSDAGYEGCNWYENEEGMVFSDVCEVAIFYGEFEIAGTLFIELAKTEPDFIGTGYVDGGQWAVITFTPSDADLVVDVLGEGKVGVID